MPCRCDGYSIPDNKEWRHNSDVAEAFCELCAWLEDNGRDLTPKAQIWWNEHKEIDHKKREEDERRSKAEATKRAALNKLTDDEKKILGIYRW